MFIHAHPDDESITTGGTIARLTAQGTKVTVLTATRGEAGEVIGDDYQHLVNDPEALASQRETELAQALNILGVHEHRFLRRPDGGRYTDSGMRWGEDGHACPAPDSPLDALNRAPLDDVATMITEEIRALHPDTVVTYGEDGGYGHPDHRMVHSATVRACEMLRQVKRPRPLHLLFIANPPEALEAEFDPCQPGFAETGFLPAPQIPSIASREPVDGVVDVTAVLTVKAQAMAAHVTQLRVSGEFFALSQGFGQRIPRAEYYTVSQLLTDTKLSPLRRVFMVMHTGVLALLVAVLGSLQHLNAYPLLVGETTVILPWGVALALVMCLACLWHLHALYRSVMLTVIAAVAISTISFLLSQPLILPGQDIVITSTIRSIVWLFGPVVMVLIPLLWERRKSRRSAVKQKAI